MKKCLLLILICCSSAILAQQDEFVEGRFKLGFLAAHRSVMGHLATSHSVAGELSYVIKGKGSKDWHQYYGNPEYGGALYFGSVGNRQLMGMYYGGMAFMRLPIIKTKSYRLSGSMGVGLGIASKYYNPDDSLLILSMGIGSRLNALVQLGLVNQFYFGKHYISLGLDMTHFSNGSTKVPNYGLNLPYLSLGYGYRIREIGDSIPTNGGFEPKWYFGAMGIASVKQINPVGGKTYPIFGFNVLARRIFSGSAGLEVSFDFFSKQAIHGYQPQVKKSQADIIQLGLFAGYIMPMNHLHVIVGMGYYVRDKYQPEDPMYHRVGLRYVFNNGLNLNLVLKSHWARADYVEYGIGYTLKR